MKANSNRAILQLLVKLGLHIDASSGFEAERAILAGIDPSLIQITGQEAPRNLKELLEKGVLFNACSLRQISLFGEACRSSQTLSKQKNLTLRINPGLGAGGTNRTTTGGRMLVSVFGMLILKKLLD